MTSSSRARTATWMPVMAIAVALLGTQFAPQLASAYVDFKSGFAEALER